MVNARIFTVVGSSGGGIFYDRAGAASGSFRQWLGRSQNLSERGSIIVSLPNLHTENPLLLCRLFDGDTLPAHQCPANRLVAPPKPVDPPFRPVPAPGIVILQGSRSSSVRAPRRLMTGARKLKNLPTCPVKVTYSPCRISVRNLVRRWLQNCRHDSSRSPFWLRRMAICSGVPGASVSPTAATRPLASGELRDSSP